MKLKYSVFLLISMMLMSSVGKADVNNERSVYSETEKSKNIMKMRDLASKSNARTINSMNEYNKAMFNEVQKGYGGYSDINVESDNKHTNLSGAERKSIENTRRNAEIMKEQLKGLK